MTIHRLAATAGTVAIITALYWRLGSGPEIDGKIDDVRVGASMADVIDMLGAPESMWRKRPDTGETVWVYRGRREYSVRFREVFVDDVIHARLGGPNAPSFNQPVDEVEGPEY